MTTLTNQSLHCAPSWQKYTYINNKMIVKLNECFHHTPLPHKNISTTYFLPGSLPTFAFNFVG